MKFLKFALVSAVAASGLTTAQACPTVAHMVNLAPVSKTPPAPENPVYGETFKIRFDGKMDGNPRLLSHRYVVTVIEGPMKGQKIRVPTAATSCHFVSIPKGEGYISGKLLKFDRKGKKYKKPILSISIYGKRSPNSILSKGN